MKKRRIPSYYILRMQILPLILFILLTFPVLINLFSSNLLELIENGTIPVEIVSKIIEYQEEDIERDLEMVFNDDSQSVNDATSFFIYVQASIFLIFIIFNYPFGYYLRKKRKHQKRSPRLERYCKLFICHTPIINSALFFIGLFIVQINQIKYFSTDIVVNPSVAALFQQLFVLSLVSSVLTAVFLYSWQKYRVQMIYMEHFFTKESLKKRRGRLSFSNMKSRLFISAVMTTFLPIVVLVFYIFLNISTISIKSINDSNATLLLGDFLEILKIFELKEGFFKWLASPEAAEISNVYYIDISGFIRLAWGFINGITVTLIYILFYLKWTNSSITRPINEIVKEMQNMTRGKPSRYALVRTKDEIGKLGEGFNLMVDGLKEREKIKSLFGQYLTREISDEILKGNVNLGGELYEATILFADIRNFTAISENMNPREVVDFLNSYLSDMIDVIIANNGIIDKFMGDGILAVFGVPVSTTDHAERGINAALAMTERLEMKNKERRRAGQFPIKIGIGVHSGPVVGGNLGNDSKLEYTVIGDTVNVASRIENLTKRYKSPLIISGPTYDKLSRELKKKINMKAIANVELKGRTNRLTLYNMLMP